MSGYNANLMRRASAEVEAVPVAAAIWVVQETVQRNNTGGEGVPPAPRDRLELRSSVRVTVGEFSRDESRQPYRVMRRGEVARAVQLGGLRLGEVLWVTWVAAHALVIEGGRRIGSHGRMLGSLQAPRGWVRVGLARTMATLSRWRYRR